MDNDLLFLLVRAEQGSNDGDPGGSWFELPLSVDENPGGTEPTDPSGSERHRLLQVDPRERRQQALLRFLLHYNSRDSVSRKK